MRISMLAIKTELMRFLYRNHTIFELIFWPVAFMCTLGLPYCIIPIIMFFSLSFLVNTLWCARRIFEIVREWTAGEVALRLGLVSMMAMGLLVSFALREGFLVSVLASLAVYCICHDLVSNTFANARLENEDEDFTENFYAFLRLIPLASSFVFIGLATVKIGDAYTSGISLGVVATFTTASLFVGFKDHYLRLCPEYRPQDRPSLDTKVNKIINL